MFYHVKDLQFNARVSKPDPRFARILLEAFGGANGELTSAMQYFVQAFSCFLISMICLWISLRKN